MTQTLFFYDLETSGVNPKDSRIMQFAGRRTTLELDNVGEPVNKLIKLSTEVLPEPGAIMLTRITPQETIKKGLSEPDFLNFFYSQIALPQTTFVGFNNVRFDDEFIRYLNYRNFYDPYEWSWRDNRSRWDLFDVIRMARALRPEGINWPVDETGKPINRLVDLASANELEHTSAHDAMSDVDALIGLARLVRKNNQKLFDYLLGLMGDKNKIAQLINSNKPFIYTAGKFSSEFEKTSAAGLISPHPTRQGALIFDLRYDPLTFKDMSPEEIYEAWIPSEDKPPFPVKTIQFNRCPAIAPLTVLDSASEKRLKLSVNEIDDNYKKLQSIRNDFTPKLSEALNLLDVKQEFNPSRKNYGVDGDLYKGFYSDSDRNRIKLVASASGDELKDINPDFQDGRLNKLLVLYKARNYPEILNASEQKLWQKFINSRANYVKEYIDNLDELIADKGISQQNESLLIKLKEFAIMQKY